MTEKIHIWYDAGWWMVELPNAELYRIPSWVYGLGDAMTLARVMVDDHHRLNRGFIKVGRFLGGCPICDRRVQRGVMG